MAVLKLIRNFLGLVLLVGLVAVWTPDLTVAYLRAKYAPAPSQFLSLDSGDRIHIRDQGNPDGPLLVMLHGSNASLHTWEPWVDMLKADYRLISIDLPGHGLTGSTTAGDYSYQAMANAVKMVADALDLPPFVLAGNSMGGAVSMAYASAHPEDLTGLILLDSGGARLPTPPKERGEDGPLAFRLAANPWLSWIIQVVTPRSLAAEGLSASFSNTAPITEAMIDRYWELARHPGSRAATAERFRWYAEGPHVFDLSAITPPTLILWGRDDRVISVALADVLDAGLPNSRKIIYDGVGHLPMEEIPAKSAKDASDFIKEVMQAR